MGAKAAPAAAAHASPPPPVPVEPAAEDVPAPAAPPRAAAPAPPLAPPLPPMVPATPVVPAAPVVPAVPVVPAAPIVPAAPTVLPPIPPPPSDASGAQAMSNSDDAHTARTGGHTGCRLRGNIRSLMETSMCGETSAVVGVPVAHETGSRVHMPTVRAYTSRCVEA